MPTSVITKFDEDNNFWEFNPQFKSFEPFNSLYKKDKTKGKWKSSQIMWAVAYLKDPDSILYAMPEEDRREAVEKDYIQIENFSFDDYQEIVDKFEELVTTQAERSLENFYKKLKERDEFLNNQNYSLELISEKGTTTVAALLDDMMSKTQKLYDSYKNIKEKVEEESGTKETGMGGSNPSMSDSGEI